MRQSRIYTDQSLEIGGSAALEGPAGHYLTRVLRLSAGDAVILFNGDGCDYTAEIREVQRQNVLLKLTGSQQPDTESSLKITLVQAISRGERMDYSLQKATELGVFAIQPLSSRRVEVRLDGKRQAKRVAHWQAVVVSACEQSGRAVVPIVSTPMSLTEWVAAAGDVPRYVLDPLAELKLSQIPVEGDSVSLLVGPEGGFSEKEMLGLYGAGVTGVSLGQRILRTETAGPAAITLLQASVGDI